MKENVNNASQSRSTEKKKYESKQCEFKKNNELVKMWLVKNYRMFYAIKKFWLINFFLRIYKNLLNICFIHCKTWKKDYVEVIEYAREILINQKHLEKYLISQKLLAELSIISKEFKKMRYKVQECGKI